jgi:hypothetical protein
MGSDLSAKEQKRGARITHRLGQIAELLKKDQTLLQDLVIALKRASVTTTGEREKLKNVKNNLLAFAINIQRARQMVSDKYPAVLVGDAAVTPHPRYRQWHDIGLSGLRGVENTFPAPDFGSA